MLVIRTADQKLYVHEIKGPNFVSWVTSKDKLFAQKFPASKIEQWLQIISNMTGLILESVEISVNGTSGICDR